MAGVRISALPSIAVPATSDIFPVVQAGVTYKETMAQLQTLFGFPSGILAPSAGGTGENNGTNTLTLSGNLATSGAFNPTLVFGASNTYTFPVATQTLAGLAGFTMSAAINMGGFQINAVATPSLGTDAANKAYVDSVANGGGAPVVAATTGALTVTQSGAGVGATLTNAGSQAAFAIDGISPTVGQRVLIKNQSTNTQNGVYIVTNVGSGSTNWVLTRAADYDTPTNINDTGTIPVESGTVNASTGWINTTIMVTVDTTAITFVKFGGAGTVSSVTFTGDGTVLSSTPSSAVTSTGTLTATLLTQTANTVFSGPSSGSPANPTFRSLVPADIASAITSGTFTPTISPATGSFATITYSAQSGEYIQIGNLVNFNIAISLSAFSIGTGAGAITIGTLPVSTGGSTVSQCAILMQGLTFSGQISAQVSGSTMLLASSTSGSSVTTVNVSGMSSSLILRISGFYFTS